MAARAYWQGQIRLALVSIPVEIYSATNSSAQVSFHQVHEPSGKRIRYEKVVPGIGPIDTDDIVKGFEVSKGNYVLLEQDEIDAVKLESKRTLELVQFVDADEIDILYFEKPYYVVPADELAEEAFIVLREALRRTKKVGLGQLAMRGREYVVSLKPCGRGLVLETLRYADELRKAQSYFREIPDSKPDADLLDLAETLIEKKSAKFDASEFHDRYVDALKGLIEKKSKAKGRKIIEETDEAPRTKGNVIDLMAALKKSVEGGAKSRSSDEDESGAGAKRAKTASARKKSATKAASTKSPATKAKTAGDTPARKRA